MWLKIKELGSIYQGVILVHLFEPQPYFSFQPVETSPMFSLDAFPPGVILNGETSWEPSIPKPLPFARLMWKLPGLFSSICLRVVVLSLVGSKGNLSLLDIFYFFSTGLNQMEVVEDLVPLEAKPEASTLV